MGSWKIPLWLYSLSHANGKSFPKPLFFETIQAMKFSLFLSRGNSTPYEEMFPTSQPKFSSVQFQAFSPNTTPFRHLKNPLSLNVCTLTVC